ncbi:MAG: fibro-slime domain-containing protein [Candidatus Fibromonas sp.]|nr:fibro-slime domain-containing protein [Candidatus Fibromonas sp.]
MKGSLKKFVLAFFVLALLSVNAMAQCGGKTVYLQLPSDWGNRIYILWEGQFISVTATKQGDWSIIKLPTTLPNDGAAKSEIIFSNANEHYVQGGMWSINTTTISKSENMPSTGKFTCSQFGPDGTYIMEDPDRATRVSISTQPPNAYYFYFLPPDDDNWILGTPYLVYKDGGKEQKLAMQIDESRCGWFKMVFFKEDPPDVPTWIWLGSGGTDKIGNKGIDEDPAQWGDNDPAGEPQALNLLKKFESFTYGNNETKQLFFVADDGVNGWGKTDPNINQANRCEYSLAAIIYDTDNTVNSSFFLDEATPAATGIAKKIPKDNLRFSDAKGRYEMEFNQEKDRWTKENFEKAFNPDHKDNVVRCYDMPFKRNKEGVWEFNSNKLCSDGTMNPDGNCGVTNLAAPTGNPGYMWGYFPTELQTRGDAIYTQCPTCDTKRKAESWVPLNTIGKDATISQYCYDRGRSGTGTACGAEFREGDFKDGDTPKVWDWGGVKRPEGMQKNALFCFESAPAEFTYEEGQEFFFSGDDDIWVYINNKLVIDLGGTHLAAPGYVDLDKLGLEKGKKYPINVFFCDRRLTMSNVRIATNLYFSQNSGLYIDGNAEAGSVPVCLASSGGGTCAAFAGKGESSKLECGKDIAGKLEYYLQKRDGTKCDLKETGTCAMSAVGSESGYCKKSGDILTCYDGIKIDLPNGKVYVNTDGGVKNLNTGSYTVYVKIAGDAATQPKRVASFSIAGGEDIFAVWGSILNEGSPISGLPALRQEHTVVAGKLVPIAFSVGKWEGDTFEFNREKVGVKFRLNQTGLFPDAPQYAGMKVYEDADGKTEVSPTDNFEIPANGVKVLYIAGEYRAADSVTYEVNVTSPKGPGFKIKVLLPELKFVDGARTPITDTKGSDPRKGATVKDREVFMGETLERYVAAFDPTTNPRVVCEGCNFPLSFRSWTATGGSEDANSNGIIQFPSAEIKDGVAQISFYGAGEVQPPKYAFFTVGGPSRNEKTLAQWDSLLFIKPPVPYPTLAEIFDRDGDGIGDEIRIVYDKVFNPDSLPNMIEVFWEPNKKETVKFGEGSWDEGKKEYSRPSNPNSGYWDRDGRKVVTEGTSSVITITGKFSDRIKTSVGPGKVEVVSWVTFRRDGGAQTLGIPVVITDRIPAIIVAAKYSAGTRCERTFKSPCRDKVTITLSEPVKLREDIGTDERDGDGSAPIQTVPFAYKLSFSRGEADFSFHSKTIDLPATSGSNVMMSWEQSGNRIKPGAKDSVVTIYYNNYTDEIESAYTPRSKDSVRFETRPQSNRYPFVDLEGNAPNPNEKGRRFEGEDNIPPQKIPLANLDPDKEFLDDDVLNNLGQVGITLKPDTLFRDDRQIAFLPSKPDWDIDSIKAYYPGSAGVLLRPDLLSKCPGESCEDITFHSSAYYHTNLGNFVVQRPTFTLKCSDDIFKINGQGDCRGNGNENMGIYIAWNLKDSNNRKVGTGAYVEVYDFYWTATKTEEGKTKKITEDKYSKKIEMLGVKRCKGGGCYTQQK